MAVLVVVIVMVIVMVIMAMGMVVIPDRAPFFSGTATATTPGSTR